MITPACSLVEDYSVTAAFKSPAEMREGVLVSVLIMDFKEYCHCNYKIKIMKQYNYSGRNLEI